MKWFKHDTNARNDIKIKLLRGQFGNDGYAAFFILLEIIGENVKANLSEWGYVDAVYTTEILAAECGVSPEKLRDIFTFCNKIGLFEKKEERLFCKNIKGRLDEYAEKLRKQHAKKRATKQQNVSVENVGTLSGQNPDIVGTQSGQGPDSVGHKKENKKENKNIESNTDTDLDINNRAIDLSVGSAVVAEPQTATPQKAKVLDIERVAAELSVSVRDAKLVAEQMRDWCKAKGKRYKDWNAALRNWIRKEMAEGKVKKQVKLPPPPTVPDISPEEQKRVREQMDKLRSKMPSFGMSGRKTANQSSHIQNAEITAVDGQTQPQK